MICRKKKCINWGIDEDLCNGCVHNHPQYEDFYEEYHPVCPLGYSDCINDPAYIKCYSPDYYKKLFGDLTPYFAAKQRCTKEKCYYDDEDK